MRSAVALSVVVLAVAGCAESRGAPDAAPGSSSTAVTAAASPATMAAPRIASGDSIVGTLREQIAVGPYVYVRLETATGEIWAAVNEAPLTIGKSITVYNAMLMERFNSPTLGRTFDRIYFGMLTAPTGAAGAPHGAGAAGDAPPVTAGAPDAVDANVGPVARATGKDGRTIAEVWTQKAQLTGARVSVRGVVVKYNAGVMGKNWIHLQDGSGSASNGTLDLTATAQSTAAVGDTVTVTGTVRTDRDFGAGYRYPLIIENATVVR